MCQNRCKQYKDDFDLAIAKSRVKIREKPITTITIATGVGLGVGLIAGLLTSKLLERRKE